MEQEEVLEFAEMTFASDVAGYHDYITGPNKNISFLLTYST
jgi:hypothetical protein